jgi:hypothetical protein
VSIGFIYFVRAGDLVKIGWTAGNPWDRLRNLQTSNGARLELLATVEGTRADERKLHAAFRALRTHGEWFALSGRLAMLLYWLDACSRPPRLQRAVKERFAWLLVRRRRDQVSWEEKCKAIALLEQPPDRSDRRPPDP